MSKEHRFIFYTLILQMAIVSVNMISAPIQIAHGFDFITDEWDATKYSSPVSQWVSELPDVHMTTDSIHSVADLSLYLSQNNATDSIQALLDNSSGQ